MKKGYTLIEVMAVLIILALISVIVTPKITKLVNKGKEDAYKVQLEQIKKAAQNWAYKNAELLPDDEQTITLTLGQLKRSKYIGYNISNPITEELIPNDLVIEIKKHNNTYLYNIIEDSGTADYDTIDENNPVLVLNGNYVEYVEINTPYHEIGAIARTAAGGDITSSINIQYLVNKSEIASIDTTVFQTYSVNYTVSDGKYASKAIRTVIINDTTPPILEIPENITISLAQVASFDPNEGVTISDNSNITPKLEIKSQLANQPGKYVITYIASDQSGNITTKKRVITVTE